MFWDRSGWLQGQSRQKSKLNKQKIGSHPLRVTTIVQVLCPLHKISAFVYSLVSSSSCVFLNSLVQRVYRYLKDGRRELMPPSCNQNLSDRVLILEFYGPLSEFDGL